jgi:hypothetical protein
MKRLAIAGSLVGALVLASLLMLASAVSAAATQTTQINATLTGVGCNSDFVCTSGGGETCMCSYDSYYFGGRGKISAPKLARFTFTGSFVDTYHADTGRREAQLELTLTTSNGDQLAIQGDDSWPDTNPATAPVPPLTWTVNKAQSTGRFANYTGSGNYTLSHENIAGTSSEKFTIGLTGSLTSS